MADSAKLSDVERIKSTSRHLRGTIAEGLLDQVTGALPEDDTQLTKFHGIYQQDDRDLRSERRVQRLEPAYSFMIRARIPGGRISPKQWLALSKIARDYANESVRLTTRQAIQYHGVIKRELKTTMQAINATLLDTLAACGDVNRNVMAPANPGLSSVHASVAEQAAKLSEHLCPTSGAYHEIWLDGERLSDGAREIEPIYGDTYLPRKFKTAFVVPPDNDVDIYSQDLGFVAVVEANQLAGYNVLVGGGMGMTPGNQDTYPRLASGIGFVRPEQVLSVAEAIVTTQRDFGNRADRKTARLKYTVDRLGLDTFRQHVEDRVGQPLDPLRSVHFTHTNDHYGWQQSADGRWHLTLFVENGRLTDSAEQKLLSAVDAIACTHQGALIITPNQNLIVADVKESSRSAVEQCLEDHNWPMHQSVLRRQSMACVGFPTCGLAMAESERYLPDLISAVERLVDKYGLGGERIVTRMTGCPNGCARPYLAEVGLVGKAPGRYSLYLGASAAGDRLSRLYQDNLDEAQILSLLDHLLSQYAQGRDSNEAFGDYLERAGVLGRQHTPEDFHVGI